MLSAYSQMLVSSSTCCHLVDLTKDGKMYTGLYNGLSNWGRIEDGQGNCVEVLYTSIEEDEDGDWLPDFCPSDFEQAGYQLI